MELTKANLLKKFGESAEVCAGSITAVVDGKKVQVATMHMGTGEYSLTDVGSEVVHGQVLSATAPLADEKPAKPSGKKKGITPAPVEPEVEVGGLEDALAGLELGDEKSEVEADE